MKTFEKRELDCFLELPLRASSFLQIAEEHICIHDDNDGNSDQCLRIALKMDSSGNEVFHLNTPTSPGLRFRNYAGGGSSLQVHNALKVLIYASFDKELFLPGLERKNPTKVKIVRDIDDILEGIIILPSGVFANKRDLPHYFFEVTSHLKVTIAVDGDTHIITEMTTPLENKSEEKQHSGIRNPSLFVCNQIVLVPYTMRLYCLRSQLNNVLINPNRFT